MESNPRTPDYVLGSSEVESQRLIKQGDLLRDLTERFLRNAGLSEGMRVLDLGCGAGDVSLLVAELVGSHGSVVGVDRDAGVIEIARKRSEERDLTSVSFVQATFDSLSFAEPFDAVVGRLVLLYQPEPASIIRQSASFVQPSGIIGFYEVDFTIGLRSWPHVALWHQCSDWIVETFRRSGAHIDMGMRLYSAFLEAGLPPPKICHDALVGGGKEFRLYRYYADTIRSLLPAMEKFGIATAEEVQIDTLAERLEQDVVAAQAQVVSMFGFGAWTRTVPR